MANYQAVFAVGDSLTTFLQNSYNDDPSTAGFPWTCTFKLFSSPDMTAEDQTNDGVVSLFLHRMTTDENFRQVTRLPSEPNETPILFLDLHYLITYWGTSAEAEHTILTWTMQQLQSNSILDSSILNLSTANAGWDTTEAIQLMPADLSLDDILRIWEAFGPKYRLSISYLARVVRIDRPIPPPGQPVVATRFTLENALT
ncbi:MAG: DUF4255 domain-containing protein [Candidatus Cybelea sp.]